MVKHIVVGLVFGCLCYGSTVFAQQDPTAPLGWQQQSSSITVSSPKLPQLQSVICYPQRCRAILSGQDVAVGGQIKGYTVSRINDSSVVLTRNGKQWQLSLFAVNIKQ